MSSATKHLVKIFLDEDTVARYLLGEKVTGLFAQPLINQSGIAHFPKPPIILDNACGMGIISSVLNDTLSDQVKQSWELTCGDFAEGMVDYTRQRAVNEGWPNAQSKLVDAQDMKIPSGYYTHVYTAFAFMAFPDENAALKESFRVLQPGGTIAISTWKKPIWVSLMKSAVETLSETLPFPDVEEVIGLFNKGWDSEAWVHSRLEQEGFEDVRVTAVTKTTSLPIADVVELNRFLIPVILERYWTQAQREQYEERIPTAIRGFLEDKYGPDGLVPLEPVAVIATGQKRL